MCIKNKLYDKIFGSVIGGPIGDAMGGPIETMHYKFIRELYNGRITDIKPYNRPEDFSQPRINSSYAWNNQAGTYTDDSYFHTLITKAIIQKNGRITAEDLGAVWINEMDPNRAWYSMKNSYYKLMYTTIPAREIGFGNIQENCSPMCIGSIGIINACNPAQAALDAYEVSSLIHEGYARESAGAIAAAVAEAMRPFATVESIVESAITYLPNGKYSKMYNYLNLAIELADKARDTEELTEIFYEKLNIDWTSRRRPIEEDGRHSIGINPCESATCAIAMFYKSKGDPQETIISSANYGRDCDTIACMAGYITGAFKGASAFPRKWIDDVLNANPEPDINILAKDLYKALLAENNRSLSRLHEIESLEKTI